MDETPLYKAWLLHAKQYVRRRGYRSIPVGFHRRVRSNLRLFRERTLTLQGTYFGPDDQAQYLNCGVPEQSIDFLGVDFEMNSQPISYCVDASILSRYNIPERYSNYSIPLYILYGCRERNHNFSEIKTIYEKGSGALSGGLVKEWLDDRTTGDSLGVYSRNAAIFCVNLIVITRTGRHWIRRTERQRPPKLQRSSFAITLGLYPNNNSKHERLQAYELSSFVLSNLTLGNRA
jgi:hypothetical protein